MGGRPQGRGRGERCEWRMPVEVYSVMRGDAFALCHICVDCVLYDCGAPFTKHDPDDPDAFVMITPFDVRCCTTHMSIKLKQVRGWRCHGDGRYRLSSSTMCSSRFLRGCLSCTGRGERAEGLVGVWHRGDRPSPSSSIACVTFSVLRKLAQRLVPTEPETREHNFRLELHDCSRTGERGQVWEEEQRGKDIANRTDSNHNLTHNSPLHPPAISSGHRRRSTTCPASRLAAAALLLLGRLGLLRLGARRASACASRTRTRTRVAAASARLLGLLALRARRTDACPARALARLDVPATVARSGSLGGRRVLRTALRATTLASLTLALSEQG